MMNQLVTLTNKVRKLEEAIEPQEKTRFVWIDKLQEITGNTIIFSWIGKEENSYPHDGPIEPESLSPDLKKRLDEVYSPIIPNQTPRISQEALKSMNEGLDKEIREVVEDLRRQGISEREIEKVIEEDDEEQVSDIVRLTGGRKGKKWSINEG